MKRPYEIPALVACALLAAALAAACGGDASTSAGAREDSAGVEIVQYPGTDRPLEWRFEREAVRGGAPEGPESFTSVSASTVDVDASGRLYVLDAAAFRVVVYDSSLSVLGTLGGEGEGPGELAGPPAVC